MFKAIYAHASGHWIIGQTSELFCRVLISAVIRRSIQESKNVRNKHLTMISLCAGREQKICLGWSSIGRADWPRIRAIDLYIIDLGRSGSTRGATVDLCRFSIIAILATPCFSWCF